MLSVTSYSKPEGGEGAAAVKRPAVNGWFNATLMRKNLGRFWPLFALYTVIWLVMLPLMQFIMAFGRNGWYSDRMDLVEELRSATLAVGVQGGIIMGGIFGVIFAMALFSYLTTARSVSMFHGFPIRREGLFLTNYVTGLVVAVAGPLLAMCLTALVQTAAGGFDPYALGMGLLTAVLPIVFYYSFAVLFAVLTGQILAIPVFYAIFNFFAYGICVLVQGFASAFYFGYVHNMPHWVEWLTPFWKMAENVTSYYHRENGSLIMTVEGEGILVIYAAAGLALAALALLLYRRRKSESAGDVVAFSWAKPVFRYGVAVSAALSLGQGMYYLLWEAFTGNYQMNFPVMMLCAIFMGLVGYYVAEMLVQKSFRVLRRSLRGAAGLVGGLILFGVLVNFDVLGVESKLPAENQIESIVMSINDENRVESELKTPEGIALLRSVHQGILAEKDTFVRRSRQGYTAATDVDASEYTYVRLRYYLKDGSILTRNYNLNYTTAEVDAGGAMTTLAQALVNPAVQHSSRDLAQVDRFTSGELSFPNVEGRSAYASLTAEQAEALYNAMQRDIDAGHFGINSLKRELWREETYANRLTLYYQVEKEYEKDDDGMRSFELLFTKHCTELLAVLAETGIITEEQPLSSLMEMEKLTGVYSDNYDNEYGSYRYSEAILSSGSYMDEQSVATDVIVENSTAVAESVDEGVSAEAIG